MLRRSRRVQIFLLSRVTYTRFSLGMKNGQADAGWDGTAEPVSRDQILRREQEMGNAHFSCSVDPEQDWQPYPVDPYSTLWDDHPSIHPSILHT